MLRKEAKHHYVSCVWGGVGKGWAKEAAQLHAPCLAISSCHHNRNRSMLAASAALLPPALSAHLWQVHVACAGPQQPQVQQPACSTLCTVRQTLVQAAQALNTAAAAAMWQQ